MHQTSPLDYSRHRLSGRLPTMSEPHRFYAVTICGKRKPGMSEEEYHRYISEKHALHLKDLLVKNKIVDYTMVSCLCGSI